MSDTASSCGLGRNNPLSLAIPNIIITRDPLLRIAATLLLADLPDHGAVQATLHLELYVCPVGVFSVHLLATEAKRREKGGACKEERNRGREQFPLDLWFHGASTDLCQSQENQLLNYLRRAYATDDEGDQLSRRIDGVNAAYVIPADRELDAGDEPCDAQDNAGIP